MASSGDQEGPCAFSIYTKMSFLWQVLGTRREWGRRLEFKIGNLQLWGQKYGKQFNLKVTKKLSTIASSLSIINFKSLTRYFKKFLGLTGLFNHGDTSPASQSILQITTLHILQTTQNIISSNPPARNIQRLRS